MNDLDPGAIVSTDGRHALLLHFERSRRYPNDDDCILMHYNIVQRSPDVDQRASADLAVQISRFSVMSLGTASSLFPSAGVASDQGLRSLAEEYIGWWLDIWPNTIDEIIGLRNQDVHQDNSGKALSQEDVRRYLSARVRWSTTFGLQSVRVTWADARRLGWKLGDLKEAASAFGQLEQFEEDLLKIRLDLG